MEQLGGVIVVGAGPVGFITALGLARQGIKVTVIEAEPKIIDSPRAAVYHPAVIRVLDKKLGILPDAMEVAVYNENFQFRDLVTGRTMVLSAGRLKDFEYPYNLHFGQDVLAGIVHKHLRKIPHTEVRWNTRLTSIDQDESGITATVQTPDGERQLRADWLVGADGGRSGTRKALNLEFQGHTWPERYVATNIYYDEFLDCGYEMANFCSHPILWCIVAIINKDNLWRVTYNEDGEISDEQAIARIPERLAALLPGSGNYKLDACAPYRVHERASEKFRVGRALLAGDAAHVCNPVGGLGLTGGIMDAQALIDALGAVINDRADESLLDVYAEERRRIFLEITSPAASEFKRMVAESDPERRRQDQEAFRAASEDPEIMRQTMMLAFQIEGSPMLDRSR